ncbi:MAG: LysM peptidoglycan-binding domain-containing protein [Acidobacteria bacterium]|nr:LysM peptidoglycan-binding domain-containing protein [Acidobacteriota bacterium]MCA1638111.1 LysM peptidoglycan-binding domain-containing protein [Acidobacteriota bacterium]
MALIEKYQSLIDMANRLGISGLNITESDDVLNIDGVAGSAEAKQQLWDEYSRLDPDFRSGDVVMNISAPEGTGSSAGLGSTYTVQSGDSLSRIGSKYGVSWQKIYEANRDKLDDPDKIRPGQELTIPQE